MKKTIGILAGMGPRSTAPFLDLFIDTYQKKTKVVYDIDFPPIFIYSLPTPFYPDKELDHEEMKKTILGGLLKLQDANVSFIAMPCMSAHAYFSDFVSKLSTPLLNMVDCTIENLEPSQKVTILGTRSTLQSKLFQNTLQDHGSSFIFEPDWQDTIDEILLKSKKGMKNLDDEWALLLEKIKEKNIETIILACTDLIINPKLLKPFTVLDSSLCLVHKIIQTYKG